MPRTSSSAGTRGTGPGALRTIGPRSGSPSRFSTRSIWRRETRARRAPSFTSTSPSASGDESASPGGGGPLNLAQRLVEPLPGLGELVAHLAARLLQEAIAAGLEGGEALGDLSLGPPGAGRGGLPPRAGGAAG